MVPSASLEVLQSNRDNQVHPPKAICRDKNRWETSSTVIYFNASAQSIFNDSLDSYSHSEPTTLTVPKLPTVSYGLWNSSVLSANTQSPQMSHDLTRHNSCTQLLHWSIRITIQTTSASQKASLHRPTVQRAGTTSPIQNLGILWAP